MCPPYGMMVYPEVCPCESFFFFDCTSRGTNVHNGALVNLKLCFRPISATSPLLSSGRMRIERQMLVQPNPLNDTARN